MCVEGLVGPKGSFFGRFWKNPEFACTKRSWTCLEMLLVQMLIHDFLHVTKLRGKVQLAKEMGVKSGRRNVQDTPVPVRVLWGGFTPLHEAAKDGDASEVKELLAKGAEVNAKNKYGKTPLHYAALNGHLDVVKELLAKGAEVDAKPDAGYTPLHEAARKGHLDVVKELLSKGAEVDAKDKYGETPLHEAAWYGHVNVVKELLAKGAEVDAKTKDGRMPLHCAAMFGRLEVVKELLAKGAKVNAKDEDGDTPLHVAAQDGHLDVVQELLSNGADTNAKSRDGKTPLQLAHDEDVLKAFGQHFITLAQRAKKSKESSKARKIVTDALQARCLPEVAQWAVNNSYGADAFPGEASMARSCVLQYMSFEARARLAAESWWSYVTPIVGAAIAAVSVYVVEPMILHHFGSVDASHHEETHAFYRGARLLVARATIKCYWPKVAFRFCEVLTIIGFFIGFAMVELWWVVWLPFVGLLFLLPGIKLYGSKELIRAPVK